MIGRPEWFTYRMFGWGLAPKKWQGWVYVAAVVLIAGIITSIGMLDSVRFWLYAALLAVVVVDVMHIMVQLPKVHDERQNYHQLIIERNVSFGAIAALIGVALYQSMLVGEPAFAAGLPFDWSIMVVIIAMVMVKAASSIYLKLRR